MKKEDFKKLYFTNNFYWIKLSNYKIIQQIGVEMGCVNSIGGTDLINMHEGFKNIGFRTNTHGQTKFQKEAFLLHNESATDPNEMIIAYNSMKNK